MKFMLKVRLLLILFLCGIAGAGPVPPFATVYIRTLLDDATQADAQTTLGLGTGDSPTFAGMTLTGITDSQVLYSNSTVLAGHADFTWNDTNRILDVNAIDVNDVATLKPNSAVFQPATNSTTFFEVKNAAGSTVFAIDTTNGRAAVGSSAATQTFLVYGYGSGANTTMRVWGDYGIFQMVGRGGTANNVNLNIRPYATSEGYIKYSHEAVADRWSLGIEPSTDDKLYLRSGNESASIVMTWDPTGSGVVDVVGDLTAGTVRSDDGVSGTLELDDGSTEKVTLVFTGGILTSRTVAATTGSVLVNWTD